MQTASAARVLPSVYQSAAQLVSEICLMRCNALSVIEFGHALQRLAMESSRKLHGPRRAIQNTEAYLALIASIRALSDVLEGQVRVVLHARLWRILLDSRHVLKENIICGLSSVSEAIRIWYVHGHLLHMHACTTSSVASS